MATRDKTYNYSVAAPGTWFTSIPSLTVTDIAGGSAYSGSAYQKGARLADVAPSPIPSGFAGQNGIIIAWNGGMVSQARKAYIKAAEGGHDDYGGNEIYELLLTDSVPGWKRIWGPSSGSASVPSTNSPHAAHADGSPANAHGYWWRQVSETGGERIWLLGSNQGAPWTTDVWSIARASLGVGVTNPALWVYHGRLWTPPNEPSSWDHEYGPSGWDSVANQMIQCAGFADTSGVRRFDVATAVAAGNQAFSGPQVPGSTIYAAALSGNPGRDSWSVMCVNTSPRCFAFGSPQGNNLWVWNLEAPGTFRQKTVTGGTISSTATCGAGYSVANRKIVIGGGELGSVLRTITIPTDLWNAGTLTMGTISLTGSFQKDAATNGTFSQGRLIDDIGDGRSCFISHTRLVTSPTQIALLPASF